MEQGLTQTERRIAEILSVVLRHYTAEELQVPTKLIVRKEDFLVYVCSGECRYDVNGKTLYAKKGDVVYFSSRTVYQRMSASPDFLTIFVYFQFERHEEETPCFQHFAPIEGVESLFLRLYKKWSSRTVAYQSDCMGLLYQLYATLLQSALSGYLPKGKRALFEEIVHTVTDDLFTAKDVNVAALAEQASMSEVHFRRCFRKLYNVSPQEFIVSRRIALAEELLLYGEESVGNIAELAGFADQGYFSRLFKHKTGHTPSEYRKLFRP